MIALIIGIILGIALLSSFNIVERNGIMKYTHCGYIRHEVGHIEDSKCPCGTRYLQGRLIYHKPFTRSNNG